MPARNRFPRKTIVLALVGFAFAAAAGVGLAQITGGNESGMSDPSTTTGTQSTTLPTSTTMPTSTTAPTAATLPTTTPTTAAETGTNGQPKVALCHHTGSTTHPAHTITVAAPAVPAHLANHHDTLGACPPVTTSTASTTTPTVTTTSPRPHHAKKPKPATKHTGHGHAAVHKSSPHGHQGTPPGHVKVHVKTGGHGQSNGSHGNSGGSHGNSGAAHGNSGGSHGNSGNGHGK